MTAAHWFNMTVQTEGEADWFKLPLQREMCKTFKAPRLSATETNSNCYGNALNHCLKLCVCVGEYVSCKA